MATPLTYSDLFARLELHRVRYVVVSGVAVALHGHQRPVADLDMVIDPDPAQARHAMSVLTAGGFVPTIPLPLELLTVLRMFDSQSREVDVFMRYQVSFEELWSGSRLVQVGGSLARVASLEHVIQVKGLRGRRDDLEDVKVLEAMRGGSGRGVGSDDSKAG